MRIHHSYNKVAVDEVKPASSASSVSKTQAAAQPQAAVQVSVSPQAQALSSAQPASDVDEAKVARLKSAVDSGSLNIDSAHIASRIVEGD